MPRIQLALPGIPTLCQLGFNRDPHVVPTSTLHVSPNKHLPHQDEEPEWTPDDPDEEGRKSGWGKPD